MSTGKKEGDDTSERSFNSLERTSTFSMLLNYVKNYTRPSLEGSHREINLKILHSLFALVSFARHKEFSVGRRERLDTEKQRRLQTE